MPPIVDPPQQRPVRILSLDGDVVGVAPHGQLRILRALMEETWKQENGRAPTAAELDSMRPRDYFDLIIGSGTGGVIAIQLGRFRLTIKEAEQAYEEIAKRVFGQPFGWEGYYQSYGNRYDHLRLESIARKQVKRYLYNERSNDGVCDICDHDGKEAIMREMAPNSADCRVGVLTVPTFNIQSVRVLRTYQSRKSADQDCKIWQAIRATTATHRMFPQIFAAGERFMGPDVGYNNPAAIARDEVYRAFGHYNIACLISIGNGKVSPGQLAKHDLRSKLQSLGKYLVTGRPDQIKVLENLARDCEHVHEGLANNSALIDRYFRFNIEEAQTRRLAGTEHWNEESKALVLSLVEGEETEPGYLNDEGVMLRLGRAADLLLRPL